MSEEYEIVLKAYEAIRDRLPFTPEIAIVLGSGLGNFGEQIEQPVEIPYCDIPGFPLSTVSGHAGTYVFGIVGGRRVVCMKGRVHYYEGYSTKQVVMPIRLMRLMGAKTLILTNAAGGVNRSFKQGDFMLITDHITNFVPSPLIGANVDEFGVRFPDMSQVYHPVLCNLARACARELSIDLKEGVYIQLTGPNYETPAEIRMVERLGADAVGMSTAIEAMTAVHAGMEVLGISLITNMACGITGDKLSHEEVKELGKRSEERFSSLMQAIVSRITM